MKHPSLRSRFAICFAVVLLALIALAPAQMRALRRPAVADFVAPMPAEQAQARVAAAQQAQSEQRAALARSLGATTPDALPFVQTLFFSRTSHHVSDRAGFLTFWREHGGVLIFGYPLSEEIVDDGRIVQYFERARFEYHSE